MSLLKRKRRNAVIGNELLESRELLNAHFPRTTVVHVDSVHDAAVRTITGTLSGNSEFFPKPSNPLVGSDTYNASGQSTLGAASVKGSDQVFSAFTSKTTYKDTYKTGKWTLTLGNGSTLVVAYGGTGHSLVSNGPYSASFEGKAKVDSRSA